MVIATPEGSSRVTPALTIQGFASDDGDVEGPVRLDELEKAGHELGALEVANLPQRDAATEMFISVGVAAGASKGTLCPENVPCPLLISPLRICITSDCS